MDGKIVLILLCIAAVCSIPAAALEITEGPILIQETDLPVHSLSTDGRYVVMSGSWENATLKTYSHKEGFISDGYIRIYDRITGTVTDVPGNVPPQFASETSVINGVITWIGAGYRFPVDHGNMRENQAFFQYTIGETWPTLLYTEPGRITREENGRILTVTGADNHPEDTKALVYDTRTKTTVQIPLSAHPSPGLVWITGDYVIWNERWSDGDGKIHVCNLATQETSTIGGDGDRLSVLDAAENTVLYRQSWSRNYTQGPFELRAANLATGETVLITDRTVEAAKIDPPVVLWTESQRSGGEYTRTLYAGSFTGGGEPLRITEDAGHADVGGNLIVWDTWDSSTGKTRVYALQLNVPGSSAGMEQLQTNVPPSRTKAGMPPQYIIGAITFALACVLAILWRK